MVSVSDKFKLEVPKLGKIQDSIISYSNLEKRTQSMKLSYDGSLFKSVMKQVEFELKDNENIADKWINYKYGLLIASKFEYIDFGTFKITECEDVAETNSIRAIGYDKMINFMIPSFLKIQYPITLLNYVKAICQSCNVELYSENFFNNSLLIEQDYYKELGASYRDILDQIAETTCSIIIIRDDKLYLKAIENTSEILDIDVINKLSLKTKIGPINSLVLSRGEVGDNVYYKDQDSILTNGLCEIKFDQNEILDKRREEVIELMFNQIKGLEFYTFEIEDQGIPYFECGDLFFVKDLKGNQYQVLILGDCLTITSGVYGTKYCDSIEQSTTEYQYATSTEKRLIKSERINNKQDGIITDTVSQVTEQGEQLTKAEQSIAEISQTVSNNLDFVRKKESINQVQLDDALPTRIQKLVVKGYSSPQLLTYPNFSYPGLAYPSSFIEDKFTNLIVTVDTQPRTSPSFNKRTYNLNIKEPLRHLGKVFDTIEIDETGKVILTRRLKLENDRLVVLSNPEVNQMTSDIQLFEGVNYVYTNGSNYTLYAEYLFNNELNKQFATKTELSSSIKQTADTINFEVSKKVNNDKILATINMTTQTDDSGSEIQMSADKLNFKGKVFNLESENITITSPHFKVSSDGTVEAINGIFSGTITGSDIIGGNIKGADIKLTDKGTLLSSNFHITNADTKDSINIGSNMIALQGDGSDFYVILSAETKTDYGYIMNVAEALRLKYNGDLYTRGTYICEKDIFCNTMYQISDRRKKKNIKKLNFNFIDDLDIKTFDFKKKFGGSKKNIGIIANDYLDKEYVDYLIKQNEDGYYSVNYQAISMCLVDKVQKLEERIKRLEEKL